MRSFEQFRKGLYLLPPFKEFVQECHDHSPYALFQAWVADISGGVPPGLTVNVSATLLHPLDSLALLEATRKWYRQQYLLHETEALRHAKATNRHIGPMEISPDSALPWWLRPGFAYVDTEVLFIEQEESVA